MQLLAQVKISLQTNRIIHGSSKKCLAISSDRKKLVMEDCNLEEGRQKWKFENYDPSKKLWRKPWLMTCWICFVNIFLKCLFVRIWLFFYMKCVKELVEVGEEIKDRKHLCKKCSHPWTLVKAKLCLSESVCGKKRVLIRLFLGITHTSSQPRKRTVKGVILSVVGNEKGTIELI